VTALTGNFLSIQHACRPYGRSVRNKSFCDSTTYVQRSTRTNADARSVCSS